MNTTTLKKIKSDVEAFHSAKLKEEKAAKAGKKPAKNKGTLKYDLDKVRFYYRTFKRILGGEIVFKYN